MCVCVYTYIHTYIYTHAYIRRVFVLVGIMGEGIETRRKATEW